MKIFCFLMRNTLFKLNFFDRYVCFTFDFISLSKVRLINRFVNLIILLLRNYFPEFRDPMHPALTSLLITNLAFSLV